MNMRLILVLTITAVLPIAWLITEFKARPSVRRTTGLLALLWSFGIAALVGALQDFNANSYFTSATKDLLEASIKQIKTGNAEAVVREWERANAEFHPTYENRARYEEIVNRAIEGMNKP